MWDLDTAGIELRELDSGSVEADVYFLAPILASTKKKLAGSRIHQLARLGSWEDLKWRDWMERYRVQTKPFPVGDSFRVHPGEPEPIVCHDPVGPRELMVPARSAFGTGAHPSSSLVVRMLETMSLRGKTVLDVGTGTGILAFVATILGADSVVCLDIDPVASFAALENSRLNHLPLRVFTGRIGALRRDARFDLALANVLPQNIKPDLADLARLMSPGGEVIFSGILTELEDSSKELLESHGFKLVARKGDGEWSALRVVRQNR